MSLKYYCISEISAMKYFFKRLCFKGSKSKEIGATLKDLMQTKNFRVTVVEEADVVEICGALKVCFTTKSMSIMILC